MKDAVWKNFIDILRSWVEQGRKDQMRIEFEETAHYTGYLTSLPAPLFNGIIQKTSNAILDVDKQTLFFLQAQVPFVWWLDPDHHHAGKTLEKKGLGFAGFYTGVAASVKTYSYLSKPGVEVREVASLIDLELFGKILGPSFGFDDTFMQKVCALIRDFGPGKSYRHYLGYLNGKAVGTMTLFGKEKLCGFWNGAVAPEARMQGVGTMLMQACMNDAAKHGYTTAVGMLMAGEMAKPLIQKFGFQPVCRLAPYVFGYDPNAIEPTKDS